MINDAHTCTTILCNGRSVDTQFLTLIHDVVQERIPMLPFGVTYTLKKICGKGFWEQLEDYELEMAGFCMSHLVSTHAVAMEEADKDVHNARLYRRKKDAS